MHKNLHQGGPEEPSSKKIKVVSFKGDETHDEIIPDSFQANPSPNPATKSEKPSKENFDVSELDKGLEKLNQKFANKTLLSPTEGSHTGTRKAKKNQNTQKGKSVVSELDRGLQKLQEKIAGNSKPSSLSRQHSEQPWEIDPSFLTIQKLLGNGSFGRVYKGTYKGEQVAVKMLEWGDPNVHDAENEIHLQYEFFKEVQVMYELESHPHICKFIGASLGSTNLNVPSPLGRHQVQVSQQMCCIVMEYIDGGNLREFWIAHRMSGKRRMPFGVIVQFAIDIARGLAYLHSKKICHRDLKPDNILMDHDCNLKIADFGLSRKWPEPNDDPMSLYKGTTTYAAPEVLDGKDYSYKADIYSYGICIWELYTCDVPYSGLLLMNRSSVARKIIHEKLRPTIPCGCPTILRHIMTRCWHRDPAKRPEMVEVLKWLSAINTDQTRFLTSDNAVECYACVVDSTCGFRT